MNNELRFNYSRSRAHGFAMLDTFGGATPPADSVLYPAGTSPQTANFEFLSDLNPYGLRYLTGNVGENVDRQINVTDSLYHIMGAHQMKFGVDYRRISPEIGPEPYGQAYLYTSVSKVLANTVTEAFVVAKQSNVELAFNNWSLFAQDTWKLTRNLTVTYGVRWEYNSAPSSPNGKLPNTVIGVENLATMTLAPTGTPFWKPQKDDFVPRLGLAWQSVSNLVFRAGGGIFYDLGYSGIANSGSAYPFSMTKLIFNTAFPLRGVIAAPPPFTIAPPYGFMSVMDPNHVLPRTYEWNAALEKTLGSADIFTLTYVGAAGCKLMRMDLYEAPNPNFSGELDVMGNKADSSYHALQAQFRHRLAHGLQTLLSYT